MRKRGRTDVNQAGIVVDARKAGLSVLVLSSIGGGCPDLLVASRTHGNVLVEIKAREGYQYTPEQVLFHEEWRGPIITATDTEGLLRNFGMVKERTK